MIGIVDKAMAGVAKVAGAAVGAVKDAIAEPAATEAAAKKEKKAPSQHRHLPIAVNPHMVELVLKHNKAKSPAELTQVLMGRMGYTLDDLKRLETRVARFQRAKAKNPGKRMPSHIRDKAIIVESVNKCVAAAFAPKKGKGKTKEALA
jgi:hypothetical protein